MRYKNFERIITGGEVFYSWPEVERAYPNKSAHALEMASKRAFSKYPGVKVYFDCMGLSFEVEFKKDYVEKYKQETGVPSSSKPDTPPPSRPRPREVVKIIQSDPKTMARVEALEEARATDRAEYQKARIIDAAKFKRLEDKIFALQKQIQELMLK